MEKKSPHLETQTLHAGEIRPRIAGALVPPIFQSTVFELTEIPDGYDDVRYPRLNNLPNHDLLARKLAALENGGDALVTASGMAAISATFLTELAGGGHLLAQNSLYGGTHTLVTDHFRDYGFSYSFVDGAEPATWEAALRPETRAIYTETITNPLMRVADHRAVVDFARQHGIVSIIDNTFATPVNFRPLALGYDLVIHSATKYLNGHNDLVAGAVIGDPERIGRIRSHLNHLGGCLPPHACFLLHRGIKTLVLRVERQNENALALARWLESRPETTTVHYAGLPGHPHHARAAELFRGCGGMVSFELGGGEAAAEALQKALEIPVVGPSLGGLETLVTRPAITSHAGLSAAELERAGISRGLLRVSVGIENVADLIADFEQALENVSASFPIGRSA